MFLSVWRGLGGCSRGGIYFWGLDVVLQMLSVMQVSLGLDVVSQMWSFFLLGVVQSAKEKIIFTQEDSY